MQVNNEFKPTIVAFCCNWCSYAGADLAGTNRLSYPADVKIIRVPCSRRVNPMCRRWRYRQYSMGRSTPAKRTVSPLRQKKIRLIHSVPKPVI